MRVFEQLDRHRKWDSDERLLLDQVDRMVADVIAPNAARFDKASEFPWANVEAINRLGLNAIFVPEAYGGAPMSFRLYLAVVKKISEACASTGIIYATTFSRHEAADRIRHRRAKVTAATLYRRGRAGVARHHGRIRRLR